MKDLIKFYLLEQPRSISDMIDELTEKDLKATSRKRTDQIPRVAGNWFRKDSGYIWQLKKDDEIRDIGRQYAIDRDVLVDDLLDQLNVYDCFPQHGVSGGDTTLNDAYASILPDYTIDSLRTTLKEDVFHGDLMADLFDFETWKNILMEPVEDDNRISLYRPILGFWPTINYIILSSLFRTRKVFHKEKMEEKQQYFDHKNRVTRLESTKQEFIERIINRIDPHAETDDDGRFLDDQYQLLAQQFGEIGPILDDDVLALLSHLYLLSLRDGVALFQQYSKHDKNNPLLFNLFERGWILEQRNMEKLSDTGNFLVPLPNLHAYLDTLGTYLVQR